MAVFSKIFRKPAKGVTSGVTPKQTAVNDETRNVFEELELAASVYAAQLEKATKELGYNIKDYEEI